MERGINTFLKTFLLTLNQRKLDLSPAIRSALAYVDEHYAEKISLDGVVEHIFINRSYFCQLFKKEVGLTFGNYVEHIRIENAKRLLASTNLPILNVAEQTGFIKSGLLYQGLQKGHRHQSAPVPEDSLPEI